MVKSWRQFVPDLFSRSIAITYTFNSNDRFLKQDGHCPMGGLLSITFSDLYLVKVKHREGLQVPFLTGKK